MRVGGDLAAQGPRGEVVTAVWIGLPAVESRVRDRIALGVFDVEDEEEWAPFYCSRSIKPIVRVV